MVKTEYQKLSTSKLMQGTFISRLSYYKVTHSGENKSIIVKQGEVDGNPITIDNSILEAECYSALEITGTIKSSATRLAEILSESAGKVFTVNFQRKPKEKDIRDSINSLNKGSFPSRSEIASVAKEAYNGTERILTGYLINPEPIFGRSRVYDLVNKGIRLVDHRHINWIIIGGTKYSLK